ncbi:hypothetical protein PVL29_000119 [Vitis rotundifolia]|uniref:VQ domain-containing protein n=1 Tax=Vitis rotundifolia TaxID=103349 RepID=A0AA39E8W8_VITRO|nr:hypothetical protein PVL29_000119 [Vitis rotundifolia]
MSSAESDQEWLQFVEEVQLSSPATSSGGGGGGKLSPANSTDQLLSPKGCISKPVRRRSRAPRRTPATLLTANTANFRALVQQFTGRPTTPFSSRSQRGPLTLNFQLGTQQYLHPFGSDYHSTDHHHHRRHSEQQQQFFPVNGTSITSEVLLSTISNGPNSQGSLITMENIPLDEHSVDCFSAGLNMNDIGYFW